MSCNPVIVNGCTEVTQEYPHQITSAEVLNVKFSFHAWHASYWTYWMYKNALKYHDYHNAVMLQYVLWRNASWRKNILLNI